MKPFKTLQQKLRLAHEAMMVNDAQSVLRQDRDQVRNHHRTTLPTSQYSPAGDDMIQIGDSTTHVHQHTPKQQWGKLLLGLGLLASGIGVPAGALILGEQLLSQPAKAVQPVNFKDTDNVLEIDLPAPKRGER